MSAEDIETLRGGYEALNRGDWTLAFRDVHPDFELTTHEAGEYRGPAAARRFMEGLLEPFEETVLEPEEFIDRGDQIVVIVHFRVRPRGSDAIVENRIGHLWTMRGGKAIRAQTFPRPEDALEAAGLRE
jgi:uncharacterized protein